MNETRGKKPHVQAEAQQEWSQSMKSGPDKWSYKMSSSDHLSVSLNGCWRRMNTSLVLQKP